MTGRQTLMNGLYAGVGQGDGVELIHPSKLVVSWARDGAYTQITWTLEATERGDTILTIEEADFVGNADAIVAQTLDATGGFNQVIIAAKARVEHGVALNVVADHA